jgi:hypothetical protein
MGEKLSGKIEKVIRAALAAEFLFWSSCVLLKGEFSNGIEFKGRLFFLMQGVLILIFALYMTADFSAVSVLRRIAFHLASGIAGIGLFAFWGLKNREQLIEGGKAFYNIYIGYWNEYYKTDYGVYNCGDEELMTTLAFGLLAVFFLCMMLRGISGIRAFMLLPPVAVFDAGLLVYALPDWAGLAFFWIGAVLLYSEGWDRAKIHFYKSGRGTWYREILSIIAVLVFGVIITSAIGKFGRGLAEQIPENSAGFIAFEEKLENEIRNLEPVSLREMNTTVSNSTPDFSNKKILSITASELPESNLYLKRFYSGIYENGEWKSEGNEFKTAAENAGIDADRLSEALGMRVYEKYNLSEDNSDIVYRIKYKTLGLKDALVPYFSDIKDSGNLIWIEKEGLVQKKRTVLSLTINGLATNDGSTSYWKLTDVDENPDEELKQALGWYDGYAEEQNLTGSDDIPALEDYVRAVKTAMGADSWFYGELSDAAVENIVRIKTAAKVRDVLAASASYNLYLDEVPEGEDVIQYFLETGHEGYCMHFATAGALILQEMGIPARYASGYVVKKSSFSREGTEYEAEVNDRNGHAWVEVYLSGVGWVPCEMTPGYSDADEDLPTDEENQEKLLREYNNNSKEAEAEVETETGTEALSDEENTENADNADKIDKVEKPADKEDGQKKTGWILGVIVMVILMGTVVAAVFVGPYIQTAQRIKNPAFRKKHPRKTIEMINQRIFRRLKKREIKTDSEYLKALIEEYPDITGDNWEKYLGIVQKAAFSAEKIPQEEAEFCFKIYLKFTARQ